MVDPNPPVIPTGTKWYQNQAFLSWVGTLIVGIVGVIYAILGKPFDSTQVTAVVAAVSGLLPVVTSSVFLHGILKIQQQNVLNAHVERLAALDRDAYNPQHGVTLHTPTGLV